MLGNVTSFQLQKKRKEKVILTSQLLWQLVYAASKLNPVKPKYRKDEHIFFHLSDVVVGCL